VWGRGQGVVGVGVVGIRRFYCYSIGIGRGGKRDGFA